MQYSSVHVSRSRHVAGKVNYNEKFNAKAVNDIFLPELQSFGLKYLHCSRITVVHVYAYVVVLIVTILPQVCKGNQTRK